MAKPKPSKTVDAAAQAGVQSALRTLEAEREGVDALATALRDGLSAPFAAAFELIRGAAGRVIVTGMGKSGHIGHKIASTFASSSPVMSSSMILCNTMPRVLPAPCTETGSTG